MGVTLKITVIVPLQILDFWLAGLDPALHGVRTHIAGVL